MNWVRIAVCIALVVLVRGLTWGQQTSAPATIAIVGIGEERQSPELRSLQDGLVHLVQSELGSRSGARVVSRRQTALFLDELGMGAAELTQSATSQRFGQAASADYLVLLRILGGTGLTAEVTVESVATAKQVWSGTVTGPTPDLPALAAKVADPLISALHLPPAQPLPAVHGATPALAVLDFHSEGAAGTLDRHLADLADLLSANLTAFDVPLVERQKLSAILAELGLSASGLVRVADIAKVGHLLGAERMLDTSMIVSDSTVVFDSQLIQPETGLVVASCRASGEQQRLPAVVQELATKVAEALRVPVTDAGRQALAQQATGSLEAALHAAAGWRLGEAGQAEEAAREYQQAVYLDPNAAGWWDQLGRQYQALDDWSHSAEAMRRHFAAVEGTASREVLAHMAQELSDAETWQGHAAESEAAAKLALHYHEDQDAYWKIFRAQAEQGELAEARQLCEGLAHRSDVPYGELIGSWMSFLGWFTGLAGRDHPKQTDIRDLLDGASRFLGLLRDERTESDSGLGVVLGDLVLVCATGQACEGLDLDGRGTYLQECLAVARRMTREQRRGTSLPARGWLVTGIIEYKLGHYDAAVDALHRCLRDYPDENYDSGASGVRAGASAGIIHYVLGRTYQQQGRRREAVEAYRTVLMLLDSGRTQTWDARKRLQALGGEALPPAPWLRRVGGAGRSLEADPRQRLAHWLRHEGYDLRDARLAAGGVLRPQLAADGIQVLVWEGRPSDYPSSEDLRAYVAGGGNLLICLGSQPSIAIIGPTLATSSQTTDLTVNWLLSAFGMAMSSRAISARSAPLANSGAAPAIALTKDASYRGVWFPIQVSPDMSVLDIRVTPDEQVSGVVTAAARVALGKVAVVSLREWFPGADTDEERDPWQYALLAGIMDWFGKPELPQRYPQAAQHWAAARDLVAVGEYGAAVQELDTVEAGVPSAADARYSAACLLADKVGDADGAVRRWREVIASKDADTWLLRMAHLRLEIAAVRGGDERTVMQELPMAAGEHPDGIWGQAWVAAGDLKLAHGDYLGAAQAFRKVADELSHSEERFRALFGLAYALNKQGKPEAAARVFDSVAAEFGKALLPTDMDQRWPDPWQTYFPRELRKQEPTVADAVAAARPKL